MGLCKGCLRTSVQAKEVTRRLSSRVPRATQLLHRQATFTIYI